MKRSHAKPNGCVSKLVNALVPLGLVSSSSRNKKSRNEKTSGRELHSMVTRWQRRLQEDHRMKRENDDTSARCFRFARRVGSCLLRVVVHSLKPNEWLKPKEEKNKPEIINS